jgi:hypothetical protein
MLKSRVKESLQEKFQPTINHLPRVVLCDNYSFFDVCSSVRLVPPTGSFLIFACSFTPMKPVHFIHQSSRRQSDNIEYSLYNESTKFTQNHTTTNYEELREDNPFFKVRKKMRMSFNFRLGLELHSFLNVVRNVTFPF